ncbi:MAG TPA: hypothetical protein VM870_07880 [Pyrinomonadaceae bacterium]|jgi:hypothetical protein|nr:hypothetical protein [Pyrinomonadaceae bacterium]
MEIKLPDSLLKQARELADEEEISLEQFVSSALAEKISALRTVDYLKQRAARADRSRFEQALGRVPDLEPEADDAL